MSPYVWGLRYRMEAARDRLRLSAASIPEIALDAGFASQQALTTAYRRTFGVKPLRDRRHHDCGHGAAAGGRAAALSH